MARLQEVCQRPERRNLLTPLLPPTHTSGLRMLHNRCQSLQRLRRQRAERVRGLGGQHAQAVHGALAQVGVGGAAGLEQDRCQLGAVPAGRAVQGWWLGWLQASSPCLAWLALQENAPSTAPRPPHFARPAGECSSRSSTTQTAMRRSSEPPPPLPTPPPALTLHDLPVNAPAGRPQHTRRCGGPPSRVPCPAAVR